jgi:glycerate kinase
LLLAAPDKFRGTLSAPDAAAAIAAGAARAGWDCQQMPVSDGGEGFLDAFGAIGTWRQAKVTGPLGRPVDAPWLRLHSPTGPLAVVESARVVGLALAGGPERNDPISATTRGVGELVAMAARDAGREMGREILVGLGGSATTDGGWGALEVLTRREPRPRLVVACDVEARFTEAATIFSRQKGAGPSQVELLRRRLERLAQLYLDRFGVDVSTVPGAGAAGGLAGGLLALGAHLVPGFEVVAEQLGVAGAVARADLVVTGEGYLDEQSFAGKAVGGVCAISSHAGVPVWVVCGDGDDDRLEEPGRVSLTKVFGRERAFTATAECLSELVKNLLCEGLPR